MLTLFRKRTFPLSWHLVALATAALIPFFILASSLVHWRVKSDVESGRQQLLEDARELAGSFDQEISSSLRALRALTAAEALSRGDLSAFQRFLARALKAEPNWINVILHDQKGVPLLNAVQPYGTKLKPPFDLKSIQQVFATGKPVVGPIALGAERYAFAVRIPVLVDGRVVYSLSAVIPVETLKMFVNHGQREWARTLLDSNNVIAMRSRNPEKFVGRPGNPQGIESYRRYKEGVIEMTSLDNERIYLGFSRSRFTNWTSAVAVPIDVLNANAHATWMTVLSSALALFFISGGVVLLYARRIAQAIRSAAHHARRIALGEAPELEGTSILEIEQLQRSLQKTAELVRANDRAKSEFFANVSHEIRTPLAAVLGFSELMSAETMSAEERRNYAQIISRNGRQLSTLVNDILDYAKVEAGKLAIEKIPTSIRETLSDVSNVAEREARRKNLNLVIGAIPDDVPQVISSDPTRLYQVLSNLILNSIKFTSSGEVRVTIARSEIGSSPAVAFEVSDTGLGMSEDQQKKLFTPFTQADTSFRRQFGGSGLGLALSRRLCRLMGGELVLVRSELGKGAVFRATIPASFAELEAFKPVADEKRAAHRDDLAGLRILVAEDSRDNQLLLEKYLGASGAKIDFVFNGEEAIETALKTEFDLILMDIQMPVLDGYSATQRLRALGYKKPIVALTAHAMQDDRERSLREGCDAHISKPIDRNQLINTIRELASRA